MARRYRQRFKLKLKKDTIYSLFSFGLILTGLLLFLSFSRSGGTFSKLNDLLDINFGIFSLLFPFVLIFFGFFFLRLKMFISRANVAIGFLIFFGSAVALTRSGVIGLYLFQFLADVLSSLGAYLVYAIGVLIGVIVFFDTSVDEIISSLFFIKHNISRLIPTTLLKTKQGPLVKKQMTIKEMGTPPAAKTSSTPVVIKKEVPLIADTLATNSKGQTQIWEYPPPSLLSESASLKADRGDVNKIAATIEGTLQSFGIGSKVTEVNLGPAVTQYALSIPLGTKVSRVTALANDLALATEAPTGQIRIEAPIPGRNLIGIEIPNRSLEIVSLRTMLGSEAMGKNKSKLAVSLGLDVSGNPIITDIAKMPHVLIAGTTGSGKSVMINSFIASLLFRASPAELK